MNPKLIEDDARRLFNANKRMIEYSHHRPDLTGYHNQLEWNITLERNSTCDGSEFILKRNGIPVSCGHMSFESAFLAIPESIRRNWKNK